MKRMLKLMAAAVAVSFAGTAVGQEALSGKEKEFLKNAAQLGLTEVQMGKLAQKRGSSETVREHGSMMVADHGKANSELMALAKEKGVELKRELAGAQKEQLDDLAKKSGAEFDREYIELQVKGHRKAIDMFQDAAKDAKDPDIKAFAQKQLPHLQHHLAALPGEGRRRTSGMRVEERRMRTGESEQAPSRKQRTEGAVRTE